LRNFPAQSIKQRLGLHQADITFHGFNFLSAASIPTTKMDGYENGLISPLASCLVPKYELKTL
jgi:hypothetical protein